MVKLNLYLDIYIPPNQMMGTTARLPAINISHNRRPQLLMWDQTISITLLKINYKQSQPSI